MEKSAAGNGQRPWGMEEDCKVNNRLQSWKWRRRLLLLLLLL
jgi:hypothetical protein